MTTRITQLGEHARTTDKRDSIIRDLTTERDALLNKVDRLEWENKGVDEWRGEYAALRAHYDPLLAAAKLALEALTEAAEWEAIDDPKRPASEAIAALKQAGVS